MKKSILAGLFSAACAVVFVGCQSPRTAGMALDVTVDKSSVPQAVTLSVDDTSVAQHVKLVNAASDRSSSGFLTLQIEVKNPGSRDFPCQYTFAWFDAKGLELQPGKRPWEQATLHGGETARFHAVAPETAAVRAVMNVRRIQP